MTGLESSLVISQSLIQRASAVASESERFKFDKGKTIFVGAVISSLISIYQVPRAMRGFSPAYP